MSFAIGSRFVFKNMSVIVASIFLLQQIAWAADLTEATLNNMTSQQSQTFAPEYLQSQEAIHQEIIDQKQAIEDAGYIQAITTSEVGLPEAETLELQGPKSGDSGVPAEGNEEYVTGETSNSHQADEEQVVLVTSESGDEIRYRNGVVDTVTKTDGTVIDYENGVVSKVLKYDGSSYIFGEAWQT